MGPLTNRGSPNLSMVPLTPWQYDSTVTVGNSSLPIRKCHCIIGSLIDLKISWGEVEVSKDKCRRVGE